MKFLVWVTSVLVVLLWNYGISESLSDESEAMVNMFRRYLANVELEQDSQSRHSRDVGRQKRSTELKVMCENTTDCGKVIQNFGLYLDPDAGMRMCKKSDGKVAVESNFDTSPYCQFLQSHFKICDNETAAMQLGCQYTCNKCNKCDDDECKCSPHATGRYEDGRYKCTCKDGFKGDGFTCNNIDECKTGDNKCHPTRATCTDLVPGYKCRCKAGFSGDGITCVDVKECSKGVHECDKQNAVCNNTIGSYTCHCKWGYEGDGRNCTPIDFCGRNLDDCSKYATCITKPHGFTCECKAPGFRDSLKKPSDAQIGRTCDDVDECKEGTDTCHNDHAKCINTIGSYRCQCVNGYVTYDEGVTCIRSDACADNECDSKHADAIEDKENNVCKCRCHPGFRSTSDLPKGSKCQNINECKESHTCHKDAICKDTVGSYTCKCKDGYYGNGFECKDQNECTLGIHRCKANTVCVNLIGSYRCDCLDGYKRDGPYTCSDINECTDKTHKCTDDAVCYNTPGSYECRCPNGYRKKGQYACEEINECMEETDNCHVAATCTNTPGSYECQCTEGFEGDGFFCEDIFECNRTNDCHPSRAECKNTIGSYTCHCKVGYVGDGKKCEDINECTRGIDDCADGRLALCFNTIGSFNCKCRTGWAGDGKTCNDVNECDEDTDDCHDKYGICHNTNGSYRCSCKTGFKGNGVNCTDINECEQVPKVHNEIAECINTVGSYRCNCSLGYRCPKGKDPCFDCEDIDECDEGTDDCHEYAICTNHPGTYSCQCKLGFEGNGKVCKDINECTVDPDICKDNGVCHNNIGSYTCGCAKGYRFGGDGKTCIDIDECAENLDNCHAKATCTNTPGSFNCTCHKGYRGTGQICVDIDECAESIDNCHIYARCNNTDGSFRCTCKTGFRGNGIECVDIEDCREKTDNCHYPHAACDNTIGSYKCTCKPGFTGDGTHCEKTPICSNKILNTCSKYADCSEDLNKAGFDCDCKFGFFGDGHKCTGSRGYEFMFLFMENIRPYSDKPTLDIFTQMYLAADKDGEITVSTSPKLDSSIKSGVDQKIKIKAGINSVNMSKLIRMSEEQQVEKKGILVKSDQLITLFAMNHEAYTSDSMLVLPLDRLGKKYYVPSTQPHGSHEDYRSQVAIVATEDQTRVTVTLKSGEPGKTIIYKGGTFESGKQFEINMQKYETFQIAHESDLTGTIISATKPVGVVSGNRCNKFRNGPRALCSHLVEMLPPLESWDKVYVVPPHYLHDGSIVRILASQTTSVSTTIGSSINKTTLSDSKFVDVVPDAKKAVVIQANNPVQVMTFAKGGRRNIDPYFTMGQGINQFVQEYHFAVPGHFDNDYVAVTIETSQRSQLRMDGRELNNPVHSTTVQVNGKQYNVDTYAIQEGSHKLATQNGARFGLVIFGDRRFDGYGYPGNMLVEGKI